MIALIADEHFPHAIVRQIVSRYPEIDFLTVQDAGLSGLSDPQLLDWAGNLQRAIVTSDASTLIGFAWSRVRAAQPMPDVVVVFQDTPVNQIIEDLSLIATCGNPTDLQNQVIYLPL